MMLESVKKLREYTQDMKKQSITPGHNPCADKIDDYLDEIEREIAERYMELPVDADGVPIHPGNYVTLDGKGGEVWLVGCRDVMCSDGMSYTASALNRVKPDPVKELLEEFAYKVCDISVDSSECEQYAARIREVINNG